ncbi:MAG TPA: hypothetical protein VNC50_17465, partial [Planctomycetia bacterium]|nr:hypothetical protein [Planctomycetia bacterium]
MNGTPRWLPVAGDTYFSALLSIRLLYPSEDADAGTGILFAFLAAAGGVFPLMLGWRDRGLRAGISLLALAGFCGWALLSAQFAEYRRPAQIMAGEWLGLLSLALYAAARGRAFLTSLAVLVTALGVGEAGLAAHQRYSELPKLREAYLRNDPGIQNDLRRAGLDPSVGLQARIEALLPQGTFGHTNSLGGMFGLAGATALGALLYSPSHGLRMGAAMALATALAGLYLSKCRSAAAGLAAG